MYSNQENTHTHYNSLTEPEQHSVWSVTGSTGRKAPFLSPAEMHSDINICSHIHAVQQTTHRLCFPYVFSATLNIIYLSQFYCISFVAKLILPCPVEVSLTNPYLIRLFFKKIFFQCLEIMSYKLTSKYICDIIT